MHPNPISTESTPLLAGPDSLKGNTVYVYVIACLSAIGGFLFGYDTGIISGAMIFIKDVFQLNEVWQESIVSSTLLAAWMFAILSGSANNYLGRKPVILGSSLIFIAGSLIMAFAANEIELLVGRLIVGGGVGLASMTVPMYIAEMAPSKIRGQLVMINMCCVTGGQFFAAVIAYWFSFIKGGHGWRYMLGFGALPGIIQFCAFIFMPESPRWLVGKGRHEEAKQVLSKVRPEGADIETEFTCIHSSILEAERAKSQMNQDHSTFRRILENQPVRKALIVGCMLQVTQQVSGINTVMYYTASIFEMSGVYSKPKALLMSAGTSFVNFTFTCVGLLLVERAGRRCLTLYSLTGVIVSLLVLAAGFQFAYENSPGASVFDHTAINQPCDSYTDCSGCARDPSCGFCFSPYNKVTNNATGQLVMEASCMHVNLTHHDEALLGQCQAGSGNNHIWAYEWCPSSYSLVTLFGMVMYLFFFGPGMGPMPWTINSEIYPGWARNWCQSASTSVCWLFNLLISMTFLSLTQAITKHGTFYLYAGLTTLCYIYFIFVLPETKGKTLEELEDLFADGSRSKKNVSQVKTIE